MSNTGSTSRVEDGLAFLGSSCQWFAILTKIGEAWKGKEVPGGKGTWFLGGWDEFDNSGGKLIEARFIRQNEDGLLEKWVMEIDPSFGIV